MPHNPLHPQLELLVPWDLPVTRLEGDRQIRSALIQLLQALQSPDAEQALQSVEQILSDLESIATTPAQVTDTKLSLKYWEIEDFDTFFNVCHVQTAQLAGVLVRALLLACVAFFQTIQASSQVNSFFVDQQRLGFIAYTQLILRLLDQSRPNSTTDDAL
jgi:hypothetical protein